MRIGIMRWKRVRAIHHEKEPEHMRSPRDAAVGRLQVGVKRQGDAECMKSSPPGVGKQCLVDWGGQQSKNS